ncbi:MAG: parallel beta-helix repeat protein [Pseudohongiellaceae bacterium]|jgi:parallel beta-helix repeat protein
MTCLALLCVSENAIDTSPNGGIGRLDSCQFIGNHAQRGGAVWATNPSSTDNCSLSGNTAFDEGGGMYIQAGTGASDGRIKNSILWSNVALSAATTEEAQIPGSPGVFLDVDYSCIQGLSGILGGSGNIGAPPLFADQDGPDNNLGNADDDLTLLLGSPCIDTGAPTAASTPPQ